jgi:hypothetical protein
MNLKWGRSKAPSDAGDAYDENPPTKIFLGIHSFINSLSEFPEYSPYVVKTNAFLGLLNLGIFCINSKLDLDGEQW